MKRVELDVKTIRSLVIYDEETGFFFWRSNGKRALATKMNRGRYYNGAVGGQVMLAHRAAWAYVHGETPTGVVDHINGNGLDNRIENLRDVDQIKNGHNRSGLNKNNTSGHMGVHFEKRRNLWRVNIKLNYKDHFVGYFDNLSEAIAAREAAEQQLL